MNQGFIRYSQEKSGLNTVVVENKESHFDFNNFLWHGGWIVALSEIIIIFGVVLCVKYLIDESKAILQKKSRIFLGVFLALMIVFTLGWSFARNGQQKTGLVKEKVYVAVEWSGEIVVIDAVKQKAIKQISLNKNTDNKKDSAGSKFRFMPHNVQVAPDNKSVWLTANYMDASMKMINMKMNMGKSGMADEIVVIDPISDKIIKKIEIGEGIHLAHIVFVPDSSFAIAISENEGMIYKINAKTHEVEKTVKVDPPTGRPHGIRISPDGKTAYIAIVEGKSIGVLDIGNFSLSYIPLKGSAVQTGVTPDGKYALASVYDAKSLAVYDIASQKLSYVDLPAEAKGPVQIYPSPDSRHVYVADQGYYFNQPSNNLVYKIDLVEMKVVQSIKAGDAPHGVVVSRDGKFVYVTNLLSGDLSVLDAVEGKEVSRITVGDMPNGVSLFYGDSL